MTPRRGVWLLVVSCTGCLGDFESTPAYKEQRFLCEAADSEEWTEAVESCRRAFDDDRSSCAGVLSLQGKLAGDPVRSTSQLSASTVTILSAADGPTLMRVDASGTTPYFAATLSMDELGGPADPEPSESRSLTIVDETDTPTRNGDVRATLTLRASDGVQSVTFAANSGSLQIASQSRSEVVGSFDAHMFDDDTHEHTDGDDDELRGCFHIFAQKTRFEEP